MKYEELTEKIIGCAIEVHRALGPGLLESTYERCLAREMFLQGISVELQVPVPVEYKGSILDCGYRADMIVEKKVLIELKSVEQVSTVHEAQMLTYMKLAKVEVGLLINFNVNVLAQGIRRFVL